MAQHSNDICFRLFAYQVPKATIVETPSGRQTSFFPLGEHSHRSSALIPEIRPRTCLAPLLISTFYFVLRSTVSMY